MIRTIDDLLETYKTYADPIGKINREIKKKNLFPVVKGLYETNINTPGLFLTAYIYGPSYVSFEFALHYYGLIPESVTVFTSATFDKKKTKKYTNAFGVFIYRDVPKSAYPFGIKTYIEDNYSYTLASPEKALCDKLYISPPQTSMKKLKALLFDDLRVDEEAFQALDYRKLIYLCDKYRSANLILLKKILEKARVNHDHS